MKVFIKKIQHAFLLSLPIFTFFVPLSSNPIQIGEVAFFTDIEDPSLSLTEPQPYELVWNNVFYPTIPCKEDSATAVNPAAIGSRVSKPLQRRSWLGGALWGTNAIDPSFFMPVIPEKQGFATTYDVNREWEQYTNQKPIVFPQFPVFVENFSFNYFPYSRIEEQDYGGVHFVGNHPFLEIATDYPGTLPSPWNNTASLKLSTPYTGPQKSLNTNLQTTHSDIQVMPLSSPPPQGKGQPLKPFYNPQKLLIDRLDDLSVDLVYEDPNHPYENTSLNQPEGIGTYLKFTACQASPLIWVESCNTPYIAIRNKIGYKDQDPHMFKGFSGPYSLNHSSSIEYIILYGDYNYPGTNARIEPPVSPALNPPYTMSNITAWVIFWNNEDLHFFADSNCEVVNNNSYLQLIQKNLNQKAWFVMAHLPEVRHYPSLSSSKDYYDESKAIAEAEVLGEVAFNFLVGTTVDYEVQEGSIVDTTFTFDTVNPYEKTSNHETILTLCPHHYQPLTLGTNAATKKSVIWDPLTGEHQENYGDLDYWSWKGNLRTIKTAKQSFTTSYLVNNLLHSMPPPDYTQTLGVGPFKNTTVGEFLFWILDKEFLEGDINLKENHGSISSWGRIYYGQINSDTYNLGFSLSRESQKIASYDNLSKGTIQTIGAPPHLPGKPPFSEDFDHAQRWIGRLLNNPIWENDRPGVNLKGAVTTTTKQVQGCFTNLFSKSPITSLNPAPGALPIIPTGLKNFAFHDPQSGFFCHYPVASGITAAPFPSPKELPPLSGYESFGHGVLAEGFGIGTNWNDHHYNWSNWIASAALLAIYDTETHWASANGTGPAVDALVMDLAYHPSVSDWFIDISTMPFPKLNFFDPWSGHGWADGFQGYNMGGVEGHNENTQEGRQPFSSIFLWGVATKRKSIADLGLFLYANASQAFDLYFFDKNRNYLNNGMSHFVPQTTASSQKIPLDSTFGDCTVQGFLTKNQKIKMRASGSPKILQTGADYSTFFSILPLQSAFISAFPITPWTTSILRDTDYMNIWLGALSEKEFKEFVQYTNQTTWANNCMPQFLMMQALAHSPSSAISQSPDEEPLSASRWLIKAVSQIKSDTVSPFAGVWEPLPEKTQKPEVFLDPTLDRGFTPLSSLLEVMFVSEHYGALDWTIQASCSDDYLFSAAFTKENKTTLVAFNPHETTLSISFYQLESSSPRTLLKTMEVSPKEWEIISLGR